MRLGRLIGVAAVCGGLAAAPVRSQDEDGAVPVPLPRPEVAEPGAGGEIPVPLPRPEPDGAIAAPPAEAAGEMPPEETACRTRLRAAGVRFEDRPTVSDEAGCGIAWPVAVSGLGSGVAISPEGLTRCALADEAAKFMRETVVPLSRSRLGSPVVAIDNASTYVCRPRNGTTRLSEHAFGNALDISAFRLADGRVVRVGAATDLKEAGFMLAVRLAACGPFTTVLGPGADADHADHFHLDLAKRRPGSAFCQ